MMSEVKRGKLLILEGGVGCGKSTQFGLLRKNFPKWEYSREPGSTPFGEDIRDAVQGIRGYGVDSYAAFFAYTAARANLIRTLVNPKLKEGKNVVLDRYWYSTYAYQGAEGVSKKYIIEVSRIATDNLQPDLVIHYDLAPKIGLKRKRGRDDTDRYDLKEIEFHNKVRRNYKKLAKRYPKFWQIVDASETIEEVFMLTKEKLKEYNFI